MHLSGSQDTRSFTHLMTTHPESSCALQGLGQAMGIHRTATQPSPLHQEPAAALTGHEGYDGAVAGAGIYGFLTGVMYLLLPFRESGTPASAWSLDPRENGGLVGAEGRAPV